MQSLRDPRHPHPRGVSLQEGTPCARKGGGFRVRQDRKLVPEKGGRHPRASRRARHQRGQRGAGSAPRRQKAGDVPRGHPQPRGHQGDAGIQAGGGALRDKGEKARAPHGVLPYAQGVQAQLAVYRRAHFAGRVLYEPRPCGSRARHREDIRRDAGHERATAKIYEGMQATRRACDEYVEKLLAEKKKK